MATQVNWNNVQSLLRWGASSHRHSALIIGKADTTNDLVALFESLGSPLPAADKGALLAEEIFFNVAFTVHGLNKLGLATTNFPHEFTSGMASERASDTLGDNLDAWDWGKSSEDFALLMYGHSLEVLEEKLNDLEADNPTGLHLDIRYSYFDTHEHFGFRDGISNPLIHGASVSRNGTIAPGEFIFGYPDERGLYPPPPVVSREHLNPLIGLPIDVDDTSNIDVGRDGSFLVIRQIRQHKDVFQSYLDDHAPAGQTPEELAAKMMGRWQDGSPLTLAPDKPNSDLSEANTFGYAELDQNGDRCPVGSHIRRSNPRDTGGRNPHQSLQISNRHRLLRRSRLYKVDEEVGMIFKCFNVSFNRQFEHVQQTWINGKRFARVNETDPVIGKRTGDDEFSFQHDQRSLRVTGLQEFTEVFGGGYFFFPSLEVYELLIKQGSQLCHSD